MPREGFSPEKVEVEVKDRLPPFGVAIEDDAKAPVRNPFLLRHCPGHKEEVTQEIPIRLRGVGEGCQMPAGDNERVDRGQIGRASCRERV